ncbi:MAG: ABC transporter ATP-binding protein [Anaerolineae bacterium]
MTDRKIMVETRELTKIYGDGSQVRALDGVNLIVREGEFVAVMGPSGSGKSTLLNMIGALDRPTSGQVMVNGQDLTRVKDLDHFRARMVGFVFQLHNLIPTLSARENVETPMRGQPLSSSQRRKRAEELLGLVGLGDRLDFLPNQLSGGERQRVAIARALANHPSLLLADEPTGNLDTESGQELMNLLAELNRTRGATIMVVTHDRRVARATQRILTMRDGRIVDDHHVRAPLVEDLREFAHSRLGELIISRNVEELQESGLVVEGEVSLSGDRLRQLLQELV